MIVYHVNMLTFYKTFYSVRNLKMKSKPSPPFPSQTLHPNTPLKFFLEVMHTFILLLVNHKVYHLVVMFDTLSLTVMYSLA